MTTAASPAATAVPFRFFNLRVVRRQAVGHSMVRITFGGQALGDFAAGGRDQRVKLFLPHPYQDTPVVPTEAGEEWFAEWRAMDPAVRGIMRTYTIREQRHEPDELDIDFALHGTGPQTPAPGVNGRAAGRTAAPRTADGRASDGRAASGPAARWAARAEPGDRVVILGPVAADNAGVDFRPPPGTDWVLLTADETALPAVAGILTWLPAGTRAKIWIEVPHPEDMRELPTDADAEITWLVRDSVRGSRTDLALDAVRAADLPAGVPYAWIAGESATVRAVRRHLVRERGFDRRAVMFTGYWRQGATEEDLVEEVVSGTGPSDDD
ncbi:siderophore-interacting protein [Streptomyces sp. B1866]|uniref:siderophore-interacting protein n=1 Tax=Streptomyces sp. B1866 TaxID=3075431 RepID=UPI0028911F73|nr:siderophore-interacting protein [Streptomyces sp. B1866]MDT3397716.1 siderophore-interacting protein [Streptomyces sp. B1866]